VLLAVLASYIPVLGAPFVWDDHHLVEESPLVSTLHPLADYFGQGFWQGDEVQTGRTYYRPLAILSLALDHQLYGNNSAGFHLTNLLFHLLSTGLLFFLLRARGAAAYAATLGTAFWALYPRLTEAVAWVSGRTDVLASCFVLCALLTHTARTRAARVIGALFLLLGLLCKEVALAGVIAVLVTELLRGTSKRERMLSVLPTLCALLVYVALRAHAIGLGAREPDDLGVAARLLAAPAAIGHYAIMLLDPWFPNIQIGRLKHPSPGYVVLGCVVTAGSLIGLGRAAKRLTPELAGALALAIVGFGLVLHLLPISVNILAADRFLYLPLLGVVLAAVPWLASNTRAVHAAWVAAALVASFTAATFVRATIWSDEVRLWTTAFREVAEEPALASVELGRLYGRAGLFPSALALYARAAAVESGAKPVALNNAASVLARSGRYGEAKALLAPLEAKYPRVPLFSLNLALFDSYLNDFDDARRHLAHALVLFPNYPQGNALAKELPNLERERARLAALPASASIERARLLAKLGLAADSLAAWRSAVASPTISRSDFEEAVWFALRQGDASTSEQLYRAYLARFPSPSNEQLALVYDTHLDLVRRLKDAWPSLGLTPSAAN
jgi:tetratricopeptide (TPR) repeat protein